MAKKTYTGQYGIVLLVDDNIASHAQSINQEHSEGNEIDLVSTHTPHISLFHSYFLKLPAKLVEEVLTDISSQLPAPAYLRQVSDHEGKYLFWEADSIYHGKQFYQIASGLIKHFAPNHGVHKSEQPHITVGHFPNGSDEHNYLVPAHGMITGVAFARFDEHSIITEIISSK